MLTNSWSSASRSSRILLALFALSITSGCTESPQSQVETKKVSVQAPTVTDDELRDMIDEELRYTFTGRRLNLVDNAAWQILHGALPFGKRFDVYNGDQPVSAIDWVLEGNQMTGWTVRHGSKDLGGRRGLKMVLESGSKTGQGHEDQWLAVISQSRPYGGKQDYPADYPVIFQGHEYQMGDIVRQVMWDVYEGKECSWTLIGLTNYLGPEYFTENTSWPNSNGEEWTVERIVEMEANENIDNSACGGTHRLIGMAMALRRYQQETGISPDKLTGGWKAAHDKIQDAIRKAQDFQQHDGCFSTAYFRGASRSTDVAVRINKSGHTLEVLALAMDDERIKEPWVTQAAVNLCELFRLTREINLECGGLYHAAHGLMEYRERRFGAWPYPGQKSAAAAGEKPSSATDEDESADSLPSAKADGDDETKTE